MAEFPLTMEPRQHPDWPGPRPVFGLPRDLPPWPNSRQEENRAGFSPPDNLPSSSNHYDMAAGSSRIYDNPQSVNGMGVPSTSSSSESSPSDGSTSLANAALLPQKPSAPGVHADCERLERSNRRMKIVFWVLIILCIFVVIVYVGIIICLLVSLNRLSEESPGSPSPEARNGEDLKDCVHENEIKEFKNIWDPEDQKDIMDMLEDSGFVFSSTTKMYCFSNLQWVPQIMGKINSRVQESVAYIEDQQEKINQTVSFYTSANNTGSQCSGKSGQAVPTSRDPTDPRYSVYAHFFLDTEANYPGKIVRWIKDGQKLSSRNRVDVSSESGQFIIRDSGFYFIYTHLVFRDDPAETVHSVFKTRKSQRTKLLESVRGPASFLQGVFRLRTGDNLTVEASTDLLDRSRDRVSYFGVYLIRT